MPRPSPDTFDPIVNTLYTGAVLMLDEYSLSLRKDFG